MSEFPSSFLTISHNIFFSEEEIVKMKIPFSEVETVGISLPVLVNGESTNEPVEEVYCIYKIRNFASIGIEPVHMTKDGYIISVGDKELWKNFLDVKEGRFPSIYLTYTGSLTTMPFVNYVNIKSFKELK